MDRLVELEDVFETTLSSEYKFKFEQNLSTQNEAGGQADFYMFFMAEEFIDENWTLSWLGCLVTGVATKWAWTERGNTESNQY
tara:strand:- start:979 stop:1227 length:249 start_codon:yes stop_codon:yes gene_type:complete